jgi:hypothetical protein
MNARAFEECVADANAALKSCRGANARWWSFGPPCNTFQLVIGDPKLADVAIMLTWLKYLSGPTTWEQQELQVQLDSHGSADYQEWSYTLIDASVGFRAVATTFHWSTRVEVLAPDAWKLWRPLRNDERLA